MSTFERGIERVRESFLAIALPLSILLLQTNTVNYSGSNASAAFDHALNYVNYVNKSAYLIFSPNLSAAYEYLNKSNELSSSSPSEAIEYANKAIQSASEQYRTINSYRAYSFAAVLAFTAAVAAALYFFMKPVKKKAVSVSTKYK
ncbi:MAG: hypothetical protein QXF01_01690 [Candidatus Micrarchaeaceae archaeon]